MARRARTGRDRLRVATLQQLVLLLAQFCLGIATNLYVTIPAQHPGVHSSSYFAGVAAGLGWVVPNGAIVLAAHAALGLALVVFAVYLLGLSIVSTSVERRTGLVTASAIGFLAIVGAAFNGASFLNYGHNVSSLVMALLFALAVGAYCAAMFILAGRRTGAVSTR